MKPYLLYLDNCCFNRPYDNHTNISVFLEAEAKVYIQRLILNKKLNLVWSYILEYENNANPDTEISAVIRKWKNVACICVIENDNIIKTAEEIHKFGVGIKDSIHLACAIESKAEFFLTTDKQILKKSNQFNSIKILNPLNFIQILENPNENR